MTLFEKGAGVAQEGFLQKHEFLIRRLHSLSGLVPVGAFMVVHLLANASIMNGESAFQNIVYQIHSIGSAILLVEWLFIFLPILFHALLGFVFIFGMKNNTSQYSHTANYRYILQRVTGIIAFFFILYHVLHMNGLIHFEWFRDKILDPVGLAQFRPYNAASTAAAAMQSPIVTIVYAIGVLSCVFHFANGLWTMGITWGVWVSPRAQAWASHVCMSVGAVLAVIGLSAIVGLWNIDVEAAEARELEMYEQRVKDGSIIPNEHKLVRHGQSKNEDH